MLQKYCDVTISKMVNVENLRGTGTGKKKETRQASRFFGAAVKKKTREHR